MLKKLDITPSYFVHDQLTSFSSKLVGPVAKLEKEDMWAQMLKLCCWPIQIFKETSDLSKNFYMLRVETQEDLEEVEVEDVVSMENSNVVYNEDIPKVIQVEWRGWPQKKKKKSGDLTCWFSLSR